jgi:hypothetical protein
MTEPDLADIEEFLDLVALVDAVPGLFLRYSHGPVADLEGPSRDYEAGVDLPGLSVTTLAPEPWWPRPAEDWVARRVCKYLSLTRGDDGRRPWVLTGTVVGYGPDHEPLVTGQQPVAWISERVVAQAHARYRQRFAVGRDSVP